MGNSAQVTLEKSAEASTRLIEFPAGLFGFDAVTQCVLVSRPEEAPFRWLELAGSHDQSFLVVDPGQVIGAYRPVLRREDWAFLGIENLEEALVLAVVTTGQGAKATLNLKSPIVINPQRSIGKQIIPRNVSAFTSQYPLEVCHP